ncbi:hypothetical protein CEXT_488771 [Caerostris extrusa]|uniref:Uncharacterized protein n=1 Tax=Caerostris extrusa TaxID=172846 RepID=A0AAV4NDH9_CAEEX|nr:hypothetical protein CEXT_488771 [Caerostris extrusa]
MMQLITTVKKYFSASPRWKSHSLATLKAEFSFTKAALGTPEYRGSESSQPPGQAPSPPAARRCRGRSKSRLTDDREEGSPIDLVLFVTARHLFTPG